jgi:hypothetical protein
VRLRVTYQRAADLAADDAEQFQKGGLLVHTAPEPGLELFQTVTLELSGFGQTVELPAQVVQTTESSVAVMFDRRLVQPLLDAANGAPQTTPPGGASHAKRIQVALHGNRDERATIMRDTNKQLHGFVLKNPQLGADEVLAFAKMSTLGADVLAQIAARRDWAARPDIAIALIRNPKLPVGAAIKLLDYVTAADLRQLAKDTRTRAPIQQAARKKIL